ncbi:hypothetical protein PCC8801_0953 [Rippkaea orientalis PCC 8801]|uniref:Shikimate kinase n=1 Tax=Rippkaea orientalis (strain PCC 8801 / RF-1) TaxID=41431 RepID=B7JZT7_RIPO1|nr:hypothetical protein [Rippkaea orientalis]ACK65030.1 hypothetical protein PCC8801_0953 [Rippkaea orientalis PCC 8801]
MKSIIITGTLVISSAIASLILAPIGEASPQCYGIDQSGATIDFSSLCNPSQPPQIPSNNVPRTTQQTDQKPSSPETNKAEKDLKDCLKSPQCSRVLGGNPETNNNQITPHQGRMDRVRNGGAINTNQ